MRDYKRILIIRLDRIGDVLLSTPAIKAVRRAYPDSYIAVMVRPYARQIVEGNPNINEIIIYDKEGREKDFLGNIEFIGNLRKKRFDLAIILHPTQRAHLITALAGIPVRLGYDTKWGRLLTKRVPHKKQLGLKHEIDYTLDLVRYIGIEATDRSLYMPLNAGSEQKIEKIFKEYGIHNNDLVIAINPGASCPSKRWPAENFAAVTRSLISKYGVKTVILSGIGDKVFADKVAFLLDNRCLNLAGKTDVADIASVLKRCRLFISNDSGPVHICCAVGTPVVAIFGRSDRGLSPERWGPLGDRDIILHKYVGCDICLAHECKIGFKCLEAVTVNDVLEAASHILGERCR
ncbi:MAG: lipopolysaccharide heptosyltransferase II [Candidatus Omnitrophica bacterium]|nr:lipopolysaccharide heptosyltransferase II [Candidatus Omnitrophota bacterium]MCM8790933.1 lipopolysaccharide heptosyltransferase II [Candidatus Omnitrophota bacterium]